jgi:Predicted NADH:ubiquinone oxidoreductase, subunit RnfD
MNFSWAAAPHIKPRDSVSKIMLKVLVALLPSVLLLAWFFGGRRLYQYFVSHFDSINSRSYGVET